MQIEVDAELLLRNARYSTKRHSANGGVVYFEDESLLGFLACYETLADLLQGWAITQRQFLLDNGGALRAAPTKAWNIYGIFLSPQSSSDSDLTKLALIEEDFRATRKIARGGIDSRPELHRALLPLLPIGAAGTTLDANPNLELSGRLATDDSELFAMLLAGDPDVSAVIAKFSAKL
jgi:hypothetical protein